MFFYQAETLALGALLLPGAFFIWIQTHHLLESLW